MPATPFHMGLAMVLKPMTPRRFSVITFGLAQILIDIEPLAGILNDSRNLHGPTHTFLGAIVIAVFGAMISPFFIRLIVTRLNQEARTYHLHSFTEPTRSSKSTICFSALFGTLSHVFLDSLIYYDMHPFSPFSDYNPFVGIISQDGIYLLCLVLGAAGLGGWLLLKLRKAE